MRERSSEEEREICHCLSQLNLTPQSANVAQVLQYDPPTPFSLSFPPFRNRAQVSAVRACVEGNVGGGVVEVSGAIGQSLTHTNSSLPNFFQHSPITATHTLIQTHTHVAFGVDSDIRV